jgi:rSAM/selenodomain-associated transferase 1
MNHVDETSIVVFAKAPVTGRVKTRLGAVIGEANATEIYQCFLEDTAETIAALADETERRVSPILAFSEEPMHPGFEPIKRAGFEFWEQGGGGLGERLIRVSRRCFESGAERVLIVGADSPTVSAAHFVRALDALQGRDAVIGPSFDGGYYLIGLSGAHLEIFRGIDWSTPRVFSQTMRRCRESSLLCEALEFWYDVDTFDDLKLLKTHLFDYLQYRGPNLAPRTAEFIKRLDETGVLRAESDF